MPCLFVKAYIMCYIIDIQVFTRPYFKGTFPHYKAPYEQLYWQKQIKNTTIPTSCMNKDYSYINTGFYSLTFLELLGITNSSMKLEISPMSYANEKNNSLLNQF